MGVLVGVLTGALLLSAAKKQIHNGDNQISMNGNFIIAQNIPGRLRIYCEKLKYSELGNSLISQMGKIDGIKLAETNPMTGTLLIIYEEKKINNEMLIAALIRLLGLEHEEGSKKGSKIMEEVRLVNKSIDYALMDKTKGMLDLKTSMAVTLIAMAVRQYIKYGNIGSPSGLTLLYWAFNLIETGGNRA